MELVKDPALEPSTPLKSLFVISHIMITSQNNIEYFSLRSNLVALSLSSLTEARVQNLPFPRGPLPLQNGE